MVLESITVSYATHILRHEGLLNDGDRRLTKDSEL